LTTSTNNFSKKEKRRVSQKKWYESNKGYFKKYRKKNKSKIKTAQRKWRETHKEQYNKYHKLYNRKMRGDKNK